MKQLPNWEIAMLEEAVAKNLRVIDEMRALALDVADPDVLDGIMGRMTNAVKASNECRRILIDYRKRREDVLNHDE